MQFLKDRLAEDDAAWKLVGNPVMISPVVFPPLDQHVAGPIADLTGILPRDGAPYNVDQWDGYTADRRELVDFLADRGIANTALPHRRHPLRVGLRAAGRPGHLPAQPHASASSWSPPR